MPPLGSELEGNLCPTALSGQGEAAWAGVAGAGLGRRARQGHSGRAAGRGHLALQQPADAPGCRVDLGLGMIPAGAPPACPSPHEGSGHSAGLFSDPFTETAWTTYILRFTHLPQKTAPEAPFVLPSCGRMTGCVMQC